MRESLDRLISTASRPPNNLRGAIKVQDHQGSASTRSGFEPPDNLVLNAYLHKQDVDPKLAKAFLESLAKPMVLVMARAFKGFDLGSHLGEKGIANACANEAGGTSVAIVSLADARTLNTASEERSALERSYPFRSLEYISSQFELLRYLFQNENKNPTLMPVLAFVKNKIMSGADVARYLHPGISVIAHHDDAHGTEWLKTLWSFLRNDSRAQRTGEELFLHRNAVLYRLNRIQELTGIDLTDAEERAYLRASLMFHE